MQSEVQMFLISKCVKFSEAIIKYYMLRKVVVEDSLFFARDTP